MDHETSIPLFDWVRYRTGERVRGAYRRSGEEE